jgi:hypothetical protein
LGWVMSAASMTRMKEALQQIMDCTKNANNEKLPAENCEFADACQLEQGSLTTWHTDRCRGTLFTWMPPSCWASRVAW